MTQDFIVALVKLGYRRMHPQKQIWGKPIAYQLFTIVENDDKLTFNNYFLGRDRQLLLFESHEIVVYDSPEISIKHLEFAARIDVGQYYSPSDFGFATPGEILQATGDL